MLRLILWPRSDRMQGKKKQAKLRVIKCRCFCEGGQNENTITGEHNKLINMN